jgi:regulator of RNase E activity RraA
MEHHELRKRFGALTNAHLTDACVRAGVRVRCAPAGMRAIEPGSRVAGRVCPARHVGSVDIFLEAFENAAPGDVLIVDNGGRLDEACVGDLVVLEAKHAQLDGLVVWGLHRDTADIVQIGLPVFSMGTMPNGPLRLDPRPDNAVDDATVGEHTVTKNDLVFGDDDGVLFLPANEADQVFTLAESIRDTERRQAENIRNGTSLRAQVRFAEFLSRRQTTPALTFRQHLRSVGGAIEE